jgi:hypothetical protein
MPAENFFKSGVGQTLAIGLGVAALAPLVLPVLARAARPAARAAIKSGIIFYERGMEMAAELGEVVDDLIAEARQDVNLEQAASTVPEASEEAGSAAADIPQEASD